MKTRQFAQLAGVTRAQRDELLSEGLSLIAANVQQLVDEHELCVQVGAVRSARLVRNAAVEEAGKFLLLVDVYRDPTASQAERFVHLKRAGDHLAKLLYARIADYSIGDSRELRRAVDQHRAGLYLEGPNEIDWILPNELVSDRESALYTDLVDHDGDLVWSGPPQSEWPGRLGKSVDLVIAMNRCGLVSREGFRALEDAWTDFDHDSFSTYGEWSARSASALEACAYAVGAPAAEQSREAARDVTELWPMPMTRVDMRLISRTMQEMQSERDTRWASKLGEEFGSSEDERRWPSERANY